MSNEDLERRLSNALAELPARVVAAYLFGSEARGEATGASDLDIAVLLRGPLPATLESGGSTSPPGSNPRSVAPSTSSS